MRKKGTTTKTSTRKQIDDLRARCSALERDIALLTSRDRSDRVLARLATLEARSH